MYFLEGGSARLRSYGAWLRSADCCPPLPRQGHHMKECQGMALLAAATTSTGFGSEGDEGPGDALQRTFKICKPYLVNAPQEDLLLLVETLLSRPDGSVSSVGSSIQGARLLLDYCRESGWRLSTLQEHILHADFGERYAFSRGVFWVGDEIVFTRMCHVEVQEGRGVVMRLGGRCRGQDMSRTCGAGIEVHLTLQENWEGRRRICGWGRETSCMCGVAVVGASGAPAHVQMHPDTASAGGQQRTWRIEEYEAIPVGKHTVESARTGVAAGYYEEMHQQQEEIHEVKAELQHLSHYYQQHRRHHQPQQQPHVSQTHVWCCGA